MRWYKYRYAAEWVCSIKGSTQVQAQGVLMVRLNELLFPSLIRTGETKFKSWSDSEKTTGLYKVDWDSIDKIKKDRWGDDESFPGTLPPKYDEWVKEMVFAIPTHYMDEIRHAARRGLVQWCTRRHFDTMIREICLMPAVSSIYVSFRLLADCLYDPEKNYFYRGEDKVLAPQALLYKFWAHQTGRGLIREHCHFEKIDWVMDSQNHLTDDNKRATVSPFLSEIAQFELNLDKIMEKKVGVTGPSIEDKGEPSGKEQRNPKKPVKMKIEDVYVSSLSDFLQRQHARLRLEDTEITGIPGLEMTLKYGVLSKSTSEGEAIYRLMADVDTAKPEAVRDFKSRFTFYPHTTSDEIISLTGSIVDISTTPPVSIEMEITKVEKRERSDTGAETIVRASAPSSSSKPPKELIKPEYPRAKRLLDNELTRLGARRRGNHTIISPSLQDIQESTIVKEMHVEERKEESRKAYQKLSDEEKALVEESPWEGEPFDYKQMGPIPWFISLQFPNHPRGPAYNLLKAQWLEAAVHKNTRNLDCGKLRKIGKTSLLKAFIMRYRENNECAVICLAVKHNVQGHEYSNLVQDYIIDRIVTDPDQIRGLEDVVIFADEVPEAESLYKGCGEFVAGFYSTPTAQEEPNLPDLPENFWIGSENG